MLLAALFAIHPLRCLPMYFRFAADAVLLLHLGFIVFALFGGALALRWRWMPLVHLPAVAWAFFVELTGRLCPLTSVENGLRVRAGQTGYADSFVEHYLLGVVYPSGLTREIQFGLAVAVVAINMAIYLWLFLRYRGRFKRRPCASRKEPDFISGGKSLAKKTHGSRATRIDPAIRLRRGRWPELPGVQYRIPVLGPRIAPSHGAGARGAQLTGQRLRVAFGTIFHGATPVRRTSRLAAMARKVARKVFWPFA